MKSNWKSILSTFAFYFISHIFLMKIVFGEFDRDTIGTGIFLGLFFAFIFPFSSPKRLKKNPSEIPLTGDERLVLKEGAKHFRGGEAVGGVLSLTNKKLVFKPHKFNKENQLREFPVSEIKAFFPHHQLTNGLNVELINHDTHTFSVESPSDWTNALAPHRV